MIAIACNERVLFINATFSFKGLKLLIKPFNGILLNGLPFGTRISVQFMRTPSFQRLISLII